jgi:ElaA protein
VRVFCDEQGVDRAAELDGRDDEAVHVIATDDRGVIGTCRLLFVGSNCLLGRMAIVKESRRRGVGRGLLEAAEAEARRHGATRIALHAQTRAQRFYAASGYAAFGAPFMEEGIEHIRMSRELSGLGPEEHP